MKNTMKFILVVFIAFSMPSIVMAYIELIAGAAFTVRQWKISLIMLFVSVFSILIALAP
ncbi:hypothetical protein ACS8E2_10175 [Psychrobacter glaciei]|uniref:hypothetical protein n=1 Tax=Psychrobacter glaciei TaxID=619771 RepID=UPI003F460CBF